MKGLVPPCQAEAIKLNGSEYANNVDKLALENARLRAANGEADEPAQKIQNAITDTVRAAVKEVLTEDGKKQSSID